VILREDTFQGCKK